MQRARVPAVLAAKSKPELELHVLELLKKLKLRDKKLEGTRCALTRTRASVHMGSQQQH